MDITFNVFHGKLWSYITFPSDSEFDHIFFIDYHFEQNSLKKYTLHKDGIDQIESITIEGSQNMIVFLESLGLKRENSVENYAKFVTNTGTIIIKPITHKLRPRINEIIFGSSSTDSTRIITLY